MAHEWREPSDFENAQASLVQIEVIELFNRFRVEGLSATVMAAGAGAALADLLTTAYGNHIVPTWFKQQADFTRKLIANAHH